MAKISVLEDQVRLFLSKNFNHPIFPDDGSFPSASCSSFISSPTPIHTHTHTQVQEAENRYEEIYNEYENARKYYQGIEALMEKASKDYLEEKGRFVSRFKSMESTITQLKNEANSERTSRREVEAQLAAAKEEVDSLEAQLLQEQCAREEVTRQIEAEKRSKQKVERQLAAEQEEKRKVEEQAATSKSDLEEVEKQRSKLNTSLRNAVARLKELESQVARYVLYIMAVSSNSYDALTNPSLPSPPPFPFLYVD